jgi:RNA polymerase sigma-70 factor (ECF subfamily)
MGAFAELCCAQETDEVLLSRARGGCQASFAAIVRRHQSQIYRIALRFARYQDDAEDISQETFLLAYRSLESFRGASKLRTWLGRIAINAALMRNRSARRRRLASEDDVGPRIFYDTDELLDRRRLTRIALDALEQLDDCQRTAFMLRDIEGMPTRKVAETMHTSMAAVRQRVYRARKNLRARIAPLAFADDAPLVMECDHP